MKKRLYALLLIICLMIIAGCATPAVKWTYPPPGGKGLKALHEKPPLPLKVAVLPFRERRANDNTDLSWFYLVPLVPFGWMDYDRPEYAGHFMTVANYTINPMEDFPQVLLKSLQEANLFQEVFFTYGADLEKADLLLAGEVVSTYYNGKQWSWCLSIVGSELGAAFGLPKYTSENKLEINLALKNIKSERNLWAYTFSKSWSVNQGYYYNRGRDVEGYPKLMQEGLTQAIWALNEKIGREPPQYWQGEKRLSEDLRR